MFQYNGQRQLTMLVLDLLLQYAPIAHLPLVVQCVLSSIAPT
jgi:hypothetical protein